MNLLKRSLMMEIYCESFPSAAERLLDLMKYKVVLHFKKRVIEFHN